MNRTGRENLDSKAAKSTPPVGRIGRGLASGKTLHIWFACAALLGSACATKPFNVKPRPIAPPEEFRARVSAGSIELRAGAIRDEDYLYRTFDANLILAGVLAVKVSITNGGAESVDLKSLRFSLNRAGQSKKPIEPRRAFKSLVKYYKIKAYNPKGYKVALADFVSYGLDARVPLPPGESRWGLIFFEIAAEQPEKTGVVLSVKGLGAVELTLNVD